MKCIPPLLQFLSQFLPLCPLRAKKSLPKNLMLVAGVLAAAVILCSQAFEKETKSILSKIQSEKSEKPADAEKKIIVAAPADAMTSGPAAEVHHTNPSLIREIILDEDKPSKQPALYKTILADIFRTLFRVVISPQAP